MVGSKLGLGVNYKWPYTLGIIQIFESVILFSVSLVKIYIRFSCSHII